MIPIYIAPIIFMLLLFTQYYWEYKRLESISHKLANIIKKNNICDTSFYRLHSSISTFDQKKLIYEIEKQLDLLLKNYNVSYLHHHHSRWAIYINSGALYEFFNKQLDKIIGLLNEDSVVFQRKHRSKILLNSINILKEIDKKLDIILLCEFKLTI
jgi:hypothetical protein